MDRRRRQKRTPVLQGCESEFSQGLSYASRAIGRKDHVAALQRLEAMASGKHDASQGARLAAMTADVLANLGRLDEAVVAFGRAGVRAAEAGQPRVLVRAALGEIRAALAIPDEGKACQAADKAWNHLQASTAALDQALDLTPSQLAQKGRIELGPRPPRASVVAHRIGTAFLQAGQAEHAMAWFRRAVVSTPNGAARARQTMSRIALGSNDPDTAERYARESLQMGRFKAKTIASWRLLVAARARQGKPPMDNDMVESLFLASKGPVRARAVLELTRALRAYRDPDWAPLAQRWLDNHRREDEVVAVELEKILHAEAKIAPEESGSASLTRNALRLLKHPQATALEMVAAAKDAFHFANLVRNGTPPQAEAIAQIVEKRHGRTVRSKAIHAMALGAIKAGRFSQARELLGEQIRQLPVGSPQWGRDVWALAMMEVSLGRIDEGIRWFFSIAEAGKAPVRFRIISLTRGLSLLGQGQRALMDTRGIQRQLERLLEGVDDYDVLLESCRQIGLAGNEFAQLRDRTAERAVACALAAFENAATPNEAVEILCRLTRRQFNELHTTRKIVVIWRQIEKRDLAAFPSAGGSWWEYLAMVFWSLTAEQKTDEAVRLVNSRVENPATPSEGKVVLAGAFAQWMIRQGYADTALKQFEWIAKEAPTHAAAAHAHYWLALRNYCLGESAAMRRDALAVRRCYGGRPGLYMDRALDCRALLLLGDLKEDSGLPYDREMQIKQIEGISLDLVHVRRVTGANPLN